MKIKYLALILAVMPMVAFSATVRNGSGRAGVRPTSAVAAKAPNARMSGVVIGATDNGAQPKGVSSTESKSDSRSEPDMLNAEECREEYRACMDDFCLLDEGEGERCSCSDNIKQSKSIIQDIQKIQSDAEKLYTEGVERERLGAMAAWVFGDSEKSKKSASGIDFMAWVGGGNSQESLDADDEIGDNLYAMAAESCEDILMRCDKKVATREEQLYQREITNNCRAFSSFLAEQKRAAGANLATAQAAVRSARLDMKDTTNKYNRGECLLAYRSCIADKGGCGVNFENCLDAALLQRRANACENILDQCMPSRKYVVEDWQAESKMILADAAKFSDRNTRLTCNAKIQNCLEEGCSTSTDTMCLSNINVAAGICPIIDECNSKVPGLKDSWRDKLASLRTDFCQKDVTKCLQDKCGVAYDAPQCTGKNIDDIVALCPQSMFVSCKNEKQYGILVNAVKLNLNYQMLNNCTNYYADLLGKTCGLDMSCLPGSNIVLSYTKYQEDISALQNQVKQEADNAVEAFLKELDKEHTAAECASVNGNSKTAVFGATRQVAKIKAEARFIAELNTQHLKLARKLGIKEAEKACYAAYKVESRPSGNSNISYISSVTFEPSLRNCHVCRKQRVCEVGGESTGAGALKGAAGGVAAGASAGSMLGPWGTAIGAVVGGLGGGLLGANSSGEKEFCQEIESCEDVNTGDGLD